METFEEDQEKIHEMINLPFTAVRKHSLQDRDTKSPTTKELTKILFEDIPDQVKEKLEEIFKLDFEMFDYNPQLY